MQIIAKVLPTGEWKGHTHIHAPTHSWSRVHKHPCISGRVLDAHTSRCLLEIWLRMTDTHTHTHTFAWLLAQTHIHLVVRSSFTLTGAFPLHACGVTRNLRIYFTSVGRVFILETAVLQTVLSDMRAWSSCFLVSICYVMFTINDLEVVDVQCCCLHFYLTWSECLSYRRWPTVSKLMSIIMVLIN